MKRRLIYTGIGSRETPPEILEAMYSIGQQLAMSGWTLRSGFADGADLAFIKGADDAIMEDGANGEIEVFIPWAGFNGAPNDPRIHVPEFGVRIGDIASRFHPAWNKCSNGAKKLHMRNVPQVLGLDLQTPTDMVICWTPNASGSGGTGQAIRIASAYGIPVFDLADETCWVELAQFTERMEAENG